MNIKHLFYPLSIAMAAMTMTACSSDDDAAVEAGVTSTFQVSINVGPAAQTRATSVGGNDGHTLYTNWDKNDGVQVVKEGETTIAGTLTANVSAGNSAYATLTGELTGTFAADDKVTLHYHTASLDYTGQKGTIADVSTSKSYLTATSTVKQIGQTTGTVKDETNNYLVMSDAAYEAQQAYLDITFTDGVGHALSGDAAGLLGGLGQTLLAEPLDGLVHVAVVLGEGLLAVHHANVGHFTQFLYISSSKCHGRILLNYDLL